jgi:hypothetical protein
MYIVTQPQKIVCRKACRRICIYIKLQTISFGFSDLYCFNSYYIYIYTIYVCSALNDGNIIAGILRKAETLRILPESRGYRSDGHNFIITESDLFIVYNPTAVWFNRFHIILYHACYCTGVRRLICADRAARSILTRDIIIYYYIHRNTQATRVCVQNIFQTRVLQTVLYYNIIRVWNFAGRPIFISRYT